MSFKFRVSTFGVEAPWTSFHSAAAGGVMCLGREFHFMHGIKEAHVWIAGLILFILVRAFSGSLLTEGALVGAILYVLSLRWGIIPFVMHKDMTLPGFPNTILKRGADNVPRFMLASACLFLCGVSLVC